MSVDFLSAAKAHWERYPLMEPRDFAKLAYQSEFGPCHVLRETNQSSEDRILGDLLAERKEAVAVPRPPEPIGNGLCRFHITQALSPRWELPLIGRMFLKTMASTEGTEAGLAKKLEQLAALPVPGMGEYLERWRQEGCPPVRHSEAYRDAYDPRYRVLRMDLARFLPALVPLEKLAQNAEAAKPALAAVDGRCGSGKTGFAAMTEILPCRVSVVHMDDFYLPPSCRDRNWMDVPAGNMDLDRFREEVLLPLGRGEPAAYRPYDCRAGLLRAPVQLGGEGLVIVEGTYSQHPKLSRHYDYKIFLTCGREEQTRRLQAREGDYYPAFDRVWRTLEERYFSVSGVEAAADLVVDTTGFFDCPCPRTHK